MCTSLNCAGTPTSTSQKRLCSGFHAQIHGRALPDKLKLAAEIKRQQFSDLVINIAPQWAWHGNWVHHGYQEAGGPGPASRNFHGDVVTLGVKYAF